MPVDFVWTICAKCGISYIMNNDHFCTYANQSKCMVCGGWFVTGPSYDQHVQGEFQMMKSQIVFLQTELQKLKKDVEEGPKTVINSLF